MSISEMIGYKVEGTADWRRTKAVEFPQDGRNLKAAEELDRLAAEIEKLDGSPIHMQLIEAEEQLCSAPGGDDVWIEIGETLSAELRSIGFHYNSTAPEFLQWYLDLLQEKAQELLDEAVPPIDINEQVANDPVVRAAKQAYEEAYTKAHAEARKKL